jgi:hypothetical protein
MHARVGAHDKRRRQGIDAFTIEHYKRNCCCPFDNPEAVGFIMVTSMVTATVVMVSNPCAAQLYQASRSHFPIFR